MNKAHSAVGWVNEPATDSPLNATNLNKMDNTIGVLDDRIITLDTTKATKTEISTLFSDVSFNENTGVITFTRKNGGKVTIDTRLEKLAINFSYNPTTEQLIITLEDGTTQTVDMSALITQYEFLDSDTITLSVDGGKVYASIKKGSITGDYLEPNYLANVTVQAEKANTSAQTAQNAATNATSQADRATTEADRAKNEADRAQAIVGGDFATREEVTSGLLVAGQADNASKLGGEAAEEWQGKIDAVQSTSSATLSQAGWYRVVDCTGSHGSLFLKIGNEYSSTGVDEHVLFFNSSANNIGFVPFSCKSTNERIFTKVRYTAEGTNRYIEVYYAPNVSISCMFSIFGQASRATNVVFKAITPTLTAETVDGVTVTTTYDIPANASPVTDLDLAAAMESYVYPKKHLNSVEQFNEYVDNYSTNLPDNSDYQTTINVNVANTFLVTGGFFTLIGHKTNAIDETQIFLRYAKDGGILAVARSKWDGVWNEPRTFATTTDLAKYLPLTGGTVNSDGTIPLSLKNNVDNAVYLRMYGKDGVLGYFAMQGADRPVFIKSDNVTILDFLHSGNYADYAVSKETGELNVGKSIILKLHKNSNAIMTCFKNNDDTTLGGMGVYSSNGVGACISIAVNPKPYTEGTGLDIYSDAIKWKTNDLLHKGNSAPVAIQSSAPSDTSALWAW